MIKIIETNLIMNYEKAVSDHQSRIIEVESWDDYCKVLKEYNGEPIEFKSLTKMPGSSIGNLAKISNLTYDEFHLTCDIRGKKYNYKKLAYLIIE